VFYPIRVSEPRPEAACIPGPADLIATFRLSNVAIDGPRRQVMSRQTLRWHAANIRPFQRYRIIDIFGKAVLHLGHQLADALRSLKRVRLGIIDHNGNGTNHGVGRKIVVEEAARAGYRLVQIYEFVKDDGMDYFLVFIIA
jgi:hypothetical protein